MLCLSQKRMVVTKDQPHSPGRSVQMFIEVECEDHSAIQAPPPKKKFNYLKINDAHPSVRPAKSGLMPKNDFFH